MSGTVGYLLDTNVISESSKRRPSEPVLSFIDQNSPQLIHVGVLTLGELRRGAKRKRPDDADLTSWIDAIERRFSKRTFPVTAEIARVWGELSAGRTRPIVDTLLAATAITHNLTLVTRNTKDFADIGVKLFNPWLL